MSNKLKNELPTVLIEGTRFTVDVLNNELRQKDKIENVIIFEYLDYKGSHYELEYDKNRKNIPEMFQWGGKQVVTVTVPEKVKLDPEGMAEKYGLAIEEIKGKSDFEVMVDQQRYNERVKDGRLPVIDILGASYSVDLARKSLLSKDNPLSQIDLESRDVAYRAGFEFLYSPAEKKILELDASKTEITKDTLLVSIPDEMKLDPVWVAMRCNMDTKDFLMKFPFQQELKAKVTPAENTWLAELIKQDKTPLIKKNSGPEMIDKKGKHL